MNNSAARACAALLVVCAAAMPTIAFAARTLQHPGGEALTDAQSAFLRVPLEDPYGLALNETVIEAVGTPAGQWTLVDDMPGRRKANGTAGKHPGDDLRISLAPGSYLLRVACHGRAEHHFDAHPVEVVAGREYVVDCRGLSATDARLRIADQPAPAPKALRPVRTALIDLPAGFEPDRISQAIKASLTNRGWEVLDEEAGRIDAIHRDTRDSTSIRVRYDQTEVTFDYLEGSKLHDEDGETAAHFSYYFRMRFLAQDVGRHLAGEPLTQ